VHKSRNINEEVIEMYKPIIHLTLVVAILSMILSCEDAGLGGGVDGGDDGDGGDGSSLQIELSFTLSGSSDLHVLRNGPGCNTADINGDGYIDVLLYGEDIDPNVPKTWTYLNNGSGSFSLLANDELEGISQAETAFVDLDNDGDQDLCVTGEDIQGSSMNYFSAVYLNKGDGIYEENALANLPKCKISAIVCGDLDGDGYSDIIISGAMRTSPYHTTTILINQGVTGSSWNGFSVSGHSTELPQLKDGSLALGDVEGDGDLDLLITGVYLYTKETALFINNGDPGSDGWDGFSDSGESFTDVDSSDTAFADIDADSDLDIIIAGSSIDFPYRTAEIWLNNGSGSYTQADNPGLKPVSIANLVTGDPDNDGDVDLVISGYESDAKYYTRFYRNDGLGNFSEEDMGFTNIGDGEGRFFDADGDGDLDFINTGEDDAGIGYTELYLNELNN